jgi:SAM-dependent methyltransferase
MAARSYYLTMTNFNMIANLFKRMRMIVNSRILKKWGNTSKKESIWNDEFSSGQWDYLENTSDDVVYRYLEKYSNMGSILDLGCGSGNTGNEMNPLTYGSYTGVDISNNAIQKALIRSKNNLRQDKNDYACSDITTYRPEKEFNIILFRESIFYIPKSNIIKVLKRYSNYLHKNGVFIVRMCDRGKYESIVCLIEKNFNVLDRSPVSDKNIVLVFK